MDINVSVKLFLKPDIKLTGVRHTYRQTDDQKHKHNASGHGHQPHGGIMFKQKQRGWQPKEGRLKQICRPACSERKEDGQWWGFSDYFISSTISAWQRAEILLLQPHDAVLTLIPCDPCLQSEQPLHCIIFSISKVSHLNLQAFPITLVVQHGTLWLDISGREARLHSGTYKYRFHVRWHLAEYFSSFICRSISSEHRLDNLYSHIAEPAQQRGLHAAWLS